MKSIDHILKEVQVNQITGSRDQEVNSVVFDSREVEKGSLFVAVKGLNVDGHKFIEKAVELGAVAIVCEDSQKAIEHVVVITVDDSHSALAMIASNFYDNPSKELSLVGVTGTNGKTTVATLLSDHFSGLGFKSGLLSTIEIRVGDKVYPTTHTTPDSVKINAMLREMVDQGVTHCFMEVSSHGIHQRRTHGLWFAGGIFTNLTHDHLDYHGGFAAYRDVKKEFFDQLDTGSFALSNIDDKNGMFMLQNTRASKKTYALKTVADYKGRVLENTLGGLMMQMNGKEVWVRLIGDFNAYNLLAIFGTADLMGVDMSENLKGLSRLETVAGRFQYVLNSDVSLIVDYAHTPDALKNVLETINAIRKPNERLLTVVGCGGDRDREKRPKMAHIAATLSDQVVFTSDNPRSEDPDMILEEMEKGVESAQQNKVLSITDRKQAIKTAVKLASKGDIILIAGKGHETYQIIGDQRLDFDDFKIANQLLTELKNQ